MEPPFDPHLESYITFLISKHVIDNGQDSETLSKFIDFYTSFNEQMQNDDF